MDANSVQIYVFSEKRAIGLIYRYAKDVGILFQSNPFKSQKKLACGIYEEILDSYGHDFRGKIRINWYVPQELQSIWESQKLEETFLGPEVSYSYKKIEFKKRLKIRNLLRQKGISINLLNRIMP